VLGNCVDGHVVLTCFLVVVWCLFIIAMAANMHPLLYIQSYGHQTSLSIRIVLLYILKTGLIHKNV